MNNRSYPHPYDFDGHPSFKELANLAAASYSEICPEGWYQFIPDWRSHWAEWPDWSVELVEFRAACYYQVGDDDNIQHIVFAFGGTDPSKLWDDYNDVFIKRKSIAPFYSLAVKWSHWMVEQIYKTFGKDIFTHAHGTMTGHSLGAFLAQTVFLGTHGVGESFDNRPFVNYVGFECPGVYESLDVLCGSRQKAMEWTNNFYKFCKTVNGRPNVVNACQQQFGQVYYVQARCAVIFGETKPPYPVPLSALRNLTYYVWHYSFNEAHSLQNIMDGLHKGEPVQRPYARRNGTDGSYYDYLTLPDMKDYWEVYTAAAWLGVNQKEFKDYNEFKFKLDESRQEAARYNNVNMAKNKMVLFAVKNDTPVFDVRPHEEKKSKCVIS